MFFIYDALAQQFGVSGRELKEFLEEKGKQLGQTGNLKVFDACYDTTTGRYLSFEEWMNVLTEGWVNDNQDRGHME